MCAIETAPARRVPRAGACGAPPPRPRHSRRHAHTQALSLDPKYVKAWARLGNVHFFLKEYNKAMDAFKAGLEVDEANPDCQEGYGRTVMKIQAASTGEVDQEQVARAAADPEIQAILRDPVVNQVLQDLQSDPAAGAKVMKDPVMSAKINKLIAAGILRTG